MATAYILTSMGGAIVLTNAFIIVNSVFGKLEDGSEYRFNVQDGDTVTFKAED